MDYFNLRRTIICAIVIIVLPIMASAQNTLNSAQEALPLNTKYDESFYRKFDPITLNDILRRIPGTTALLASLNSNNNGANRGFGSDGEQLLIDGKRLSGKSNNVSDQLERIMAKDVDYIELIRGTTSDLDVRTDGLVINVLMKKGQTTSSTVWTAKGGYTDGRDLSPSGVITHSGSNDDLSYSATVEKIRRLNTEDSFYTRQRLSGTAFQDVDTQKVNTNNEWDFNGNATYAFDDGSIFRLNGLYKNGTFDSERSEDLVDFEDPADSNLLIRDEVNDKYEWEIGGDYEKRFDTLGLFKTLFIVNKKRDDDKTQFPRTFADASRNTNSSSRSDRIQQEKIIRSSLSKNFTEKHSLEAGVEYAINDQYNFFQFGTNDAVVTNIQETRTEVFSTYSYNFSQDLLMQVGLIGEFSEISVEGSRSDNYFFLKPRLDVRYDLTDSDQFRLVIDRQVEQLEFDDFFASIDMNEVSAKRGNTDIVQEKNWEYSLAYEKQLPSNAGSITLKAFYQDISDRISSGPVVTPVCPVTVPICTDALATSFDYSDEPGNQGSGTNLGIEVDASLRLDWVGIPDAVLSVSYEKQDTNWVDPFLGIERRFNWRDDYKWEIDFQHDITSLGLSYGVTMSKEGPTDNIDNDEHWFVWHDEKVKFFIEKKIFNNMKLRFAGDNLLHNNAFLTRNKYLETISFDNIDFIEQRITDQYSRYELSIQGTF